MLFHAGHHFVIGFPTKFYTAALKSWMGTNLIMFAGNEKPFWHFIRTGYMWSPEKKEELSKMATDREVCLFVEHEWHILFVIHALITSAYSASNSEIEPSSFLFEKNEFRPYHLLITIGKFVQSRSKHGWSWDVNGVHLFSVCIYLVQFKINAWNNKTRQSTGGMSFQRIWPHSYRNPHCMPPPLWSCFWLRGDWITNRPSGAIYQSCKATTF